MKKFATFLLILAMIMSLSIPAFAATNNNSITVTNAQAGETYSLYKMFDLTVDSEEEPKAYTYTVMEDWATFFGESGAGKAYITVNEAGAVTAVSDAVALAKAAAAWAGKPAATKSIIGAEGENVVFEGLGNGYWLITSTLGTEAMIETTPDKVDVAVEEKNSSNTINKLVQEDSTLVFGERNDAQIGDLVSFKSTVTIVKNTRNVVVHDKMDGGLTYTPNSVAIEGLTKGTDYTVNETPADGHTFDISFSQNWIDGLDFETDVTKTYEITYTATLNENAVVDDNGFVLKDQKNKTYVSFGEGSASTEETTITNSYKFNVFKHATDSDAHLAGAHFQLMKGDTVVNLFKLDDNNYRIAVAGDEQTAVVDTFVTVATGDISIWGVDNDTDYTLVETEAPAGYNQLNDPVSVTVDTGNGTQVDVENNAGGELPSTGGVGTTLFYIFGGIMVLAAVVLLVTKKRMTSAE